MRYKHISLFLICASLGACAGRTTVAIGGEFAPRPAPVVAGPGPAPAVPEPTVALAGMGHWVVVDGVQYWSPERAPMGWVPYQNGNWSWVEGDGWTWVSNDPWGWYTDHYGVWRHHLPLAGYGLRLTF